MAAETESKGEKEIAGRGREATSEAVKGEKRSRYRSLQLFWGFITMKRGKGCF
jgi:hypothetical protein